MSLLERNLAQIWIAAQVARDMRCSYDEALASVAQAFAHLFPEPESYGILPRNAARGAQEHHVQN